MKKKISDDDLLILAEKKKTKPFGSALRKPKRTQVNIESFTLCYECVLSVSGKYTAKYFRKATHTISVPDNVDSVLFGDSVFSIRAKSGFGKLAKIGTNKINISLEEHVSEAADGQYFFDYEGNEIKFSPRLNSKTTESYPFRVLEKHQSNLVGPQISYTDLITKFTSKLTPKARTGIRDLKDDTAIKQITEIYIPIYVVTIQGPKKNIATMRIDAHDVKIL